MTKDTSTSFERCIVIVNPVSTHAVPVRRRIAALKRMFADKDFRVLETSPDGRAANQALLASHARWLGPDTLLCIAAGDGTVNMFAEALAQHPKLSKRARETTLLPLWGGNANDLAHMLNGRPGQSLGTLLKRSSAVAIRPLECTFRFADGRQEVRIAVCYASFGATGEVAKEMAQESHRNHPLRRLHASRLLLEFVVGFKTFSKASGFHIVEGSKRRKIYERMITNGPRYAKIGRTPVSLKDEKFFMHSLESTNPLSAIPVIVKISIPKIGNQWTYTDVTFVIEEEVLAQLDGELATLPAGTEVRVRLAKTPIRVLSSQLT